MHSCKVTFTNTNVKYISILILFCEMYCCHQTCCFQKMIFDDYYAPFEEEGVYCFAHVGRSVGRSVRPPNGFRMISQECLGLGSWNFIGTLIMTGRWPLIDFKVTRSRSRSRPRFGAYVSHCGTLVAFVFQILLFRCYEFRDVYIREM